MSVLSLFKNMNFSFKTAILIAFSIATSNNLFAQTPTPGTWNPTPATTTVNAVGIGTTTPIGWQEISYCNGQQNGLVVTKTACPTSPVSTFSFSFDGVAEPIFGPEGGSGSPFVSYPPADFTLRQYGSFISTRPMIWARMQNDASALGLTSGPYTSRFIVTPSGQAGINIESPRSTFDIKSLGSYNYPGLIVGRQQQGSSTKTQHVMFIPLLATDGYNKITQQNDQGMFFTDGKGISGANLSSSFVIAPWSDANSPNAGGLRIDNMGNIEIAGTTRTTQLKVNLKWWSDSVFANNYDLMSLADVENFVNINKHLPNVPSESELKETGIDVAEMQAVHMEKIEELTLYTIAQEKEIKSLKEQQINQSDLLKKQQAELEELKKKLNLLLEAQLQNK